MGGIAALLVAMALVPVRDHTANVNIALALVIVVVIAAGIGGSQAGLVTALTAALAFDFFFTQPYQSLKISAAGDVQTTVLLLLVGLLAGQVAARSRRPKVAKRSNLEELRRLQRVTDLAANGDTPEDLVLAVEAELIETLQLVDCRFERPPFVGTYPELTSTGGLVGPVTWRAPDGLSLPSEGVTIPVIAGDALYGRYVLIPTPGLVTPLDRRLIATALVGQLRVALAARPAA